MNKMIISVVIPLYNKQDSIAHTLECVLNQTYLDFEVVVVDDGSKDQSAAVVEQFTDSRIRLIKQKNGGVSAARNRGIEEARGAYVAFLDADDVWLPDHLANLVSLITNYPQCRAWSSSYVNNENGVDHTVILNKLPFVGESGVLSNYFEVCSCSHPPVWSSAVCVEKSLLTEIGGFPVGVTSGEDLLTWARIAVKTDWAYSMKATAVYMMPITNTFTEKPTRPNDSGDPVCEGLKELLKSDYPKKKELKHFIGRFYKMKASTNLRYGERWSTLCECFKSLFYRPFAKETYPIMILALMPRFIQRRVFTIHSYDKVADIKKILGGGKQRLLVFHPIIAPYRIDFFNSLSQEFEAKICLIWRNLHDQTFDYAKIEEQFVFTPDYLDKRLLRVIPKGVVKTIKEFKPDIVLVPECGLLSLLVVAYRAWSKANYSVVSMIDDSFDMINGHQFSKKHEWAEKILIPRFDNVINVDSRTTAFFRQKYAKGIYFPIIADEKKARERYQRILPLSEKLVRQYGLEEKKIVLFVGRLVAVKNIPALIKVFRSIAGEDYRLVLVGDGDCREELSVLSKEDVRILLVGRYEGDELFAWYNLAQVFCLPSLQEAFGAVTNEALLGGCWCLISEKAGSQCLISNGENGMVFDPNDERELKKLLVEALEMQKPLSLPLRPRSNNMKITFKNEIRRVVENIS